MNPNEHQTDEARRDKRNGKILGAAMLTAGLGLTAGLVATTENSRDLDRPAGGAEATEHTHEIPPTIPEPTPTLQGEPRVDGNGPHTPVDAQQPTQAG